MMDHSKPYTISLLIIFVIHLVIFVRLTLKHKKGYLAAASAAFLLLAASMGVRMWRPDLNLGGYALFDCFRILGWVATALTALLFIRHKQTN